MEKGHAGLFILLGALGGLTPLAIDMYLPAMPAIASDLGAGVEGAQLTVSLFMAGFALGQLFYGPLADSLGRKRVLVVGLGLFVLASLGCALVNSLPWLLALRFVQALGGAAAAVVVNALLRDLFSGMELVRAMSMVMMTMTLAPLVAPLIGGALLGWGWRTIFVTLALLAVLVLWQIVQRLPETLTPARRRSLDMATIYAGYLLVMRHRGAMRELLSGILANAGMFAFISGSPYVYITYFGVQPAHYGLLFAVNVGVMTVLTWINSRVVRRFGLGTMMRWGLRCIALASLALLWVGLTGSGGLWGVMLAVVLFMSQLGFINANSMSMTLSHFPANAGTASALAGTLRFGLGALTAAAVNLVPAQSPLPMCLVMAICGLLALLLYSLPLGDAEA